MALRADPHDPLRVWAAVTRWRTQEAPALLRSDDGGATWSEVASGRVVRALWLDERVPGSLLAVAAVEGPSGATTLLRSRDFGATWEDVGGELAQIAGARAVDVHPRTRRILVEAGGLWVSTTPLE